MSPLRPRQRAPRPHAAAIGRPRGAMRVLVFALALALAGATSTGCYSSTRIYSQPTGARVVMDGQKQLGITPIELEDLPWVWTSHTLAFYKDGYEPQLVRLTGQFRTGTLVACLCTFGLLLPVMLVAKYPAQVGAVLPKTQLGSASSELSEDASIHFAHRSDGAPLR